MSELLLGNSLILLTYFSNIFCQYNCNAFLVMPAPIALVVTHSQHVQQLFLLFTDIA